MHLGSKWSIFLWSLFAFLTLTATQNDKTFPIKNVAVSGGPYLKFCYGFSSIINTRSLRHGHKHVHKSERPDLHYEDCEVVIGNLVLTDLNPTYKFDSIKIVTGYLHISNIGIPKLSLNGLQYVLGRELGTGRHNGASVIIEGKPVLSFDPKPTFGSFDVELPKLRIARGKVSLSGLLKTALNPMACDQAKDFYSKMLNVDKNSLMRHMVLSKDLRFEEGACAAHTSTPSPQIKICPPGEGYTTTTGCGKCNAKILSGFCVGSCPPGLFQYNNECHYTCPAGTMLSDNNNGGIARCQKCSLSFNPSTNNFGNCQRTCYTGFMLPLTRLQFREFYLDPQKGGMRTFKQTTTSSSTGYCITVNGNIVLQKAVNKDQVRLIPPTHMYLLRSVTRVTGYVLVEEVFIPADTLQLLEAAWGGLFIKSTVFPSLDLPVFTGVSQQVVDERLKHIIGNLPSPKPSPAKVSTRKQMYLKFGADNNNYCLEKSECSDGKCGAPHFCATGCTNNRQIITTYVENQAHTFCGKPSDDRNVYSLGNGRYMPCNVECSGGCQDETTFSCKQCRHLTLSTFNMKSCVSVCPLGFYSWMKKECRRCAPECGTNGCYNKGTELGEKGCKKCDVSFLSRSGDGIYRIQCGLAGSTGEGANYIEEAMEEYYPKPPPKTTK